MLSLLLFSLEVTGPIALVVILGMAFRRWDWINDAFVQGGSKLVFNVALPSLLFLNIVSARPTSMPGGGIIFLALVFTALWFLVLSLVTRTLVPHHDERGVFVQGSFRGNMGIVGLAFCLNAFGQEAALLASVYLAFVTLLYNILAVVTLSRWSPRASDRHPVVGAVQDMAKNPLIIAILLASAIVLLNIPVPNWVMDTGEYFARMTLPLALICVGASLSWRGFIEAGRVTAWASAFKLIFIPGSAVLIAHWLGYSGIELGVFYLMSASPTAAASYVMVRAMGGNANLAASIIATSTVLSLITTSLGLVALRALGWV
ncbi:AEC family transporter [Saccharospirillum mangrovi]|uniref:AEC family transporter n=1 Tax=Saccharospirillum mangrovi TaxID=2161747 RepID=UPI000D36EE32|nr:AEC family transporter [Saccharospirillum mangrovi]